MPRGYSRKKHKWLALSKDLLAKHPMNSKVIISGISSDIDGEYRVKDKTSDRFRNRVDLLILKGDIKGIWKKVKIKKV